MKTFLLAAVLVMFTAAAGADQPGIPDPDQSQVIPWDTWGVPFMTPGQCSDVDDVLIIVRDKNGDPITGAEVLIDLVMCDGLCPCPDDGLEGETNGQGEAELNPAVGGCWVCWVHVYAIVGGVPYLLREYFSVVSTDWNGANCDGAVGGSDFAFFAVAFMETQDECADYNGDGVVSGSDFAIFAASFACPDQCVR